MFRYQYAYNWKNWPEEEKCSDCSPWKKTARQAEGDRSFSRKITLLIDNSRRHVTRISGAELNSTLEKFTQFVEILFLTPEN